MRNDDNKAAAIDFLRLVATGHVAEGFSRYAAPRLKHHNPHFAAGAEALKAAMEEAAKQNPDTLLETRAALADGELVAVHSSIRMKPSDPPMAVVHLFKFEAGKIVELWDVVQAPPEKVVNADGMF